MSDWTERQYHVAGPLGARLMDAFLAWGWISRSSSARSVSVTALGWEGLKQHFGISRDACGPG